TTLLGPWGGGRGAHAVLRRDGAGGAAALLAVVGAVGVADTAAYAVGSRLGRRPLAPRISPNKTVEGVVAGVLAAGLLGAVALPAAGLLGDPVRAAMFGVLVAAAGVLGDLAESMLKRDLGVKDLGRALPGHGGVLDRVDALLLALPVGHHLLALLA
ncbi:MAG: phosphatidate cytidylyltransferase, partial [Nitriliruptoraceae bacterium]